MGTSLGASPPVSFVDPITKADLQELLQRHEGNLEEIHSQLQAEARKNPYVRKLLQGYLDGSEPTGAIDSLRNGFSGPFQVPPPPPRPPAMPPAMLVEAIRPMNRFVYRPTVEASSTLRLLLDVAVQ